MKPLIALAMLESGRGLPWDRFVCTGIGERPTCHVAHGSLDLEDALCVSCNRWFGFTLGKSPLTPFYRDSVALFVDRIGFGHTVFGDAVGPYDARYVAIGQGPVTTTPLHMVRIAALLANGGRLVTPHVVATVGGAPQRWPAVDAQVSPVSIARVREGMRRVVSEPGGTAARVDWDRVPATVYGKTGTSQVGKPYRPRADDVAEDGPWHHWFMGWAEAPGERPLAFCVLLYARTEAAAGATAAPLAADFLAWWFSGERQ
jgi:cell division protein FtsI/penicillin-binding protein 2